jgi:hypothetical protein
MPDVPDQQIARRVEEIVQGDGQLDGAEVRGEVATGLRDRADDLVAQFVGELRQLLAGEPSKLLRVGGAIE